MFFGGFRISYVLCFISICDLFTDSASYTIRGVAEAGIIPVIQLLGSSVVQ
jgi:hypothetical protein